MASPNWTRLRAWALVLPVALVASCGGDERAVTLAVAEVTWSDPQTLLVSTECATEVRVEVGPDAGGSDVAQLSVFGDPQLGRCVPTIEVPIAEGTTKVIDAATSQVIELPPIG